MSQDLSAGPVPPEEANIPAEGELAEESVPLTEEEAEQASEAPSPEAAASPEQGAADASEETDAQEVPEKNGTEGAEAPAVAEQLEGETPPPPRPPRWRQFLGWSPADRFCWRWLSLLWSLLFLLGSAVVIGMLSLRLAAGSWGDEMFQSYLEHPLLVVLNVAPVIWAALVLWAVTGRVWASVLISGAVTMILTIINAVKLALRDTPFLWEDLALAGEAGDMAGKYEIVLTDGEWYAIGVVVVLTLICAVLARRRPAGWIRKGAWRRLACLVVLAVVGAVGWQQVYQSAAVYQATANNDLINIWNDTEVFQSRGFLYPFFYSAKSAKDDPPEGYSVQAAQEILAEYEDQNIPEDEKINVMGIMLEAYTDLTDYEQLAFAEPAYEALHTLEAESWSGTLITNIFAGGTIDTERAFVTGYADQGSYRAVTNSYAWYFRGQGYTVEGSHPGYSWFYNRTNVNANLGFERYLFSEGYYEDMIDPVAAPYHSDGVFLDHLADLLEEGEKPYFSFSVTYQNHGPYEGASTTWEDYMPEDCTWSENTQNILNNYLDGVRRTGEHLLELTERLEAMEEPVVLVAFGDHKPWLGDGNSVYNEVGINLDLGTAEGFQSYYSTPYFIWANSAAKEVLGQDFVGEGPTISPCFLMTELFDQCGWEGNAFMQLSREVKALVPVITETDRYLESGVSYEDLTEEQQEAVTRFDFAQYYWRKDAAVAEADS